MTVLVGLFYHLKAPTESEEMYKTHEIRPFESSFRTRWERLKSALYLRLRKRKDVRIFSGRFLKEKVSVSKQSKCLRARKKLQKFGYSVLKQMRALFHHTPSPQ